MLTVFIKQYAKTYPVVYSSTFLSSAREPSGEPGDVGAPAGPGEPVQPPTTKE